ncbi:MAG: response regulator [Moorea sp. SIOASIH]|uniref:ATP-binding protein n=1 Tax=Moorena sp. SIOASIH TaxID=2607817 RepID=UPI0013B6B7F8|nr:ATP-binding protein [Moorena sp. SIOASIH]NEO35916.1 response regulator [Moorena sp. SIOASIH]
MVTRVLVVEDEVIVAKTIASQLKQLGYMVSATASSGSQAITKAAQTKPDLVLMDIFLKGKMDGITAARQIREHLRIPIVYLTAYADEDTLQRAKVTQPFGYVTKPFNERDLRVAIEMALQQYQMEQSLQSSQAQLSSILNSIDDAVIATTTQGTITFMNASAEALTGWNQSEVWGRDVTSVFPIVNDLTGNLVKYPLDKVIKTGQVVYLGEHNSLITKDGGRIAVGNSASPLKDQLGNVNGVVLAFWDISEDPQTEMLEQVLAKEQEIQDFRSQFVSTVCHEFRNPLSVILTAAELLKRYGNLATQEQKQRYLKRITISVERMTELMEEVLLIGQAEVGRLEFIPTPMNLEQFCQDLIAELCLDEASRNRIVFTSDRVYTEVCMDDKLIHYIITNLLTNALKYSPSDEIVTFHLTCDLKQQLVVFRIQDKGIGIAEADQKKIFDSFYRAKNVGTIQGTGLGLSIVKRCVEQHQGEIEVTSQLGVGTTFTIKIPIVSNGEVRLVNSDVTSADWQWLGSSHN